MRMILAILTLLAISTATFAQQPTDGNFIPNLVRLRDNATFEKQLFVKEDGAFLVIVGIDAMRIESYAPLNRRGCNLSFSETTDWYRVVVVADACKGTGKATINYFGLGTITIIDSASN